MSVCVVHADIAILFMFIFSSFSSSTFHCLLAVKNIQSIVVPFRVPTSFLLFVSKTIYTLYTHLHDLFSLCYVFSLQQ